MKHVSKKRIFKKDIAQFLANNGAELLETREGEVPDRPDLVTYFFNKDERLFKALDKYHR